MKPKNKPSRKRTAAAPPVSRRGRRSVAADTSAPEPDFRPMLKGRGARKTGSKADQQEAKPSPEELIIEEASIGLPDGLETLLDVPGRKPLPEIPKRAGRKERLPEIIEFAPEVYSRMIAQIRLGVSFNVAAEAAGINEATFYDWGWRGANDREQGIDSYYSRMYSDVRRANAYVTADCEQQVRARNPTRWLSQGPGRIFGNPWGDNANKRQLPGKNNQQLLTNADGDPIEAPLSPDKAIDGVFTLVHHAPSQEIEDESLPSDSSLASSGAATGSAASHSRIQANGRSHSSSGNGSAAKTHPAILKLTPQQEYETLQVYEELGAINISESLRKAFQDQISTNQPT